MKFRLIVLSIGSAKFAEVKFPLIVLDTGQDLASDVLGVL